MAEINDNELEAATGGTGGFAEQGYARKPTDPCCGGFKYVDSEMQQMEKTIGSNLEKKCGLCAHLKWVQDKSYWICDLGM